MGRRQAIKDRRHRRISLVWGIVTGDGKTFGSEDIVPFLLNADFMEKTIDSFHTKSAKRAGQKRIKTYQMIAKELDIELRGKDLK